MSRLGVPLLQKLFFVYNDMDRSSLGIRQLIHSPYLAQFKQEFPHVQCKFIVSRSPEHSVPPYLEGHYLTGRKRRIAVTDYPMNTVAMYLWHLGQIAGRDRSSAKEAAHVCHVIERTHCTTVQGGWSPYLWVKDGPDVDKELVEEKQLRALEQELRKLQETIEKEKVFRDVSRQQDLTQAEIRQARIQAEKAMSSRFSNVTRDKTFLQAQKQWSQPSELDDATAAEAAAAAAEEEIKDLP